jgi:hypothetical protein
MAIRHYPSMTELSRTEPFELEVARGLIAGHISLNISGYQSAVSTTFIPIWEHNTPYVYPVENGSMLLSSTSASDTNVLVRISGLDVNYLIITEDLLLTNGITGVNTAKSYFRVTSLTVIDGGNPVGAISLTNASKSETYAEIAVGAGVSSMTIYTVPAGYTFYLANVNGYATQGNNQITNYRSFTINSAGIHRAILRVPFLGEYKSLKTVPRPYVEKTDIQWQCSSSQTSQVGLQIEGILIKNDES